MREGNKDPVLRRGTFPHLCSFIQRLSRGLDSGILADPGVTGKFFVSGSHPQTPTCSEVRQDVSEDCQGVVRSRSGTPWERGCSRDAGA